MEFRRILASDTIDIRHSMLRAHGPISSCHYPGDDDDLSFHLGSFIQNQLVSVASFYFQNHNDLNYDVQYRLRGMATVPDYQGRGLSSRLLKMAFPIIKQNQGKILWCNARESAIGYYHKVGLKALGEVFPIEDIGPHQLMYKEIH